MQNSSAFQFLALDTIHESATNPRRTFEESKLHELAESIRQAVSPSECPASSCSMSSFTLAAMTSLLVCGLGAVGTEVTLLVSFVVAMLLMR